MTEDEIKEYGRVFSFSPSQGPFTFIVILLACLAKWVGLGG
jgi:hypothetical protein